MEVRERRLAVRRQAGTFWGNENVPPWLVYWIHRVGSCHHPPDCTFKVCDDTNITNELGHFILYFPELFFFNGHTHRIWKFPGQGLNLSCSCDLCHRSFNPLHQAGYGTHASAAAQAAAGRFLTCCTTAGNPGPTFYKTGNKYSMKVAGIHQ